MHSQTHDDTQSSQIQDISTSPWVRIVIVAYNSGTHLQKCVNALAAQSCRDFEVVIVDNQSPDECIKTLVLPDERFNIIHAADNFGFAGGSNLGLAGATTPWVMTINPDVRTKRNCLKRLKQAAETYPKAAMFSPVLLRAERKKRFDGAGDVLSIFGIAWRGGFNAKIKKAVLDKPQSIFAPCGAAALYRRDVFEAQHGFDETFFCYLEDVDLGLRINATGGSCVLVHNAKVFHVGGATTGEISGFQEYYTCRNNLRMILKSAPLALLPIMLAGYGSSQIWITFRNRKNPTTSAKLRGYRDAIKGAPASLKARWQRPRYKFGSSLHLGRKLVWQKKALKTRDINSWPISDDLKESL